MDFQDKTNPPSDLNNAMPTETPAPIPTEFDQPSNQVESTSPISHIDSNTPLDLGDTSQGYTGRLREYTEVANPPLAQEPLQTETLDNTFQEPVQTEIINSTFEEPIQTENTTDREAITPEQEKLNIEFASFMKEQFPAAFTGEGFGADTIYTASVGDYIDSKAFATYEMRTNETPTPISKGGLYKVLQNVREFSDVVESTDMKAILKDLLSFDGSISFSKKGLEYSDGRIAGATTMLRPESLKGFKKDEVNKLFEALSVVNVAAELKLEEEEQERMNVINTVEDLKELLPITRPSI